MPAIIIATPEDKAEIVRRNAQRSAQQMEVKEARQRQLRKEQAHERKMTKPGAQKASTPSLERPAEPEKLGIAELEAKVARLESMVLKGRNAQGTKLNQSARDACRVAYEVAVVKRDALKAEVRERGLMQVNPEEIGSTCSHAGCACKALISALFVPSVNDLKAKLDKRYLDLQDILDNAVCRKHRTKGVRYFPAVSQFRLIKGWILDYEAERTRRAEEAEKRRLEIERRKLLDPRPSREALMRARQARQNPGGVRRSGDESPYEAAVTTSGSKKRTCKGKKYADKPRQTNAQRKGKGPKPEKAGKKGKKGQSK